jgi:hypothetical protein
MITLYDLLFDKDLRPSLFCWRTKLALKHKGLTWRDEPCGFTDKQKIAFAGSQTYPVIHDGTNVVKDSWAIAEHLDAAYPDKPLMPNKPYARFVNGWADTAVNVTIFPIIVGDLGDRVRPQDKDYFVDSRGKRLGLDAQKLFNVVSTASGSCWSLVNYCPVPGPVPASPANRDYQAGFTAAMMLKDLLLAQQASAAAGAATPLGAEAAQLFSLFVNAGNAGKDFSGIIKMLDGK